MARPIQTTPREVFDPAARAAEKKASRDADARALVSGAKTLEQLRHENAFALPPPHARIDHAAIPRFRLR